MLPAAAGPTASAVPACCPQPTEYCRPLRHGDFTQSGGTNPSPATSLSRLRNSGGNGTYSLSGSGQLSAPTEYVGYYRHGDLHPVRRHQFRRQPLPRLDSASNGTYNLNGGTLIPSSLSSGSGTAAFNFGGGTLQASGPLHHHLAHDLDRQRRQRHGRYRRLYRDPLGLAFRARRPDQDRRGTLILAGSNIYSGGTEVDDGTLVAANGSQRLGHRQRQCHP